MKETHSLSQGTFASSQRLERIKEDCSSPEWDGEDALAVSKTSFNNAREFLSDVPLGICAPDPGIDAKGFMTLEWRRSDGRLLSLTFDDKDNVHMLVFLKIERFYGSLPVSSGYSGKLKYFLEDIIRD